MTQNASIFGCKRMYYNDTFSAFSRPLCVEINPCTSDPCIHGSCSDLSGPSAFSCSCDPGWTGTYCQYNIDDCASEPCKHDGICSDMVNGFQCNCTEGWTGKYLLLFFVHRINRRSHIYVFDVGSYAHICGQT